MLWGEDSLPYSIYHDTRGEAFASVNYIISVYEANASPLRKIPRYIPKSQVYEVGSESCQILIVANKGGGSEMVLIRRASEADFIFTVEECTEELRVLKFNGIEGISKPFRYTLKLAARDSELDFSTIVGKPAYLTINGETGERYVNGIITRLIQAGTGNRFTFYNVKLVPLIWLLKYKRDCRIFQNKTIQEIITQIFNDAGIGSDYYRFSLTGTHNAHEYCVQYRESSFNFISRLMEEEAMFYYFEHSEDMHVMVIADNSAIHTRLESPTIVYNEPSSMVPDQECIYEYRFLQQIRPGVTSLRDFNYESPNLDLGVTLPGEELGEEEENLEIYDYPGDYQELDMGDELVSLRLEALRTNRQLGLGKSLCRRFIPGYRFTLDQYVRSGFNQEYLIINLKSIGEQPLGEDQVGEGFQYNNDFECIPYAVTYRPLRKTSKPIVEGVQTAIVVGPGGDDIYFDELARVKIQFHWDREGRNDENSSCWIRVSDGYAGQNHGIQFTPLVGDEVIVSFLEGDPDKPIITGRVYNGNNMPPLDPAESIQNAIITPYNNRMRFDDKKQAILISTGKNQQFRIRDNPTDSSDEEKGYGNYIILMTSDGHSIYMAYGDEYQHIRLNTSKNHSITLDDKAGSISITSAGGHNVVLDDANKNIALTSTDGHYITIRDDSSQIVLSDSSGDQMALISSGGNITIINSSYDIALSATSGKIKLDASNIDIISSGDIKMEAKGKIEMKSVDIIGNASAKVNLKGGAQASMKAMDVSVEGTKVSIKGAIVDVKGAPIKLNSP